MEVLQTLNSSWKSHTLVQSQKKKELEKQTLTKHRSLMLVEAKLPTYVRYSLNSFLVFSKEISNTRRHEKQSFKRVYEVNDSF